MNRLGGAPLYQKMLGNFDFTAILETAVRECGCAHHKEARELLEAFLQWFSLIPLLEQNEALQMLRKVDPIWHAFILNTRLYREFCEQFIGYFIDHDPMEVNNHEIPKETYASFTLTLLEKEFGGNMSPALALLAEGATCCYFNKKCKSRTATAKSRVKTRTAQAA